MIELVRRIKSELEARGEDLSGPCGAWKITRRVAAILHADDPNYGLFESTPPRNNCEGYADGVIGYKDGRHWDILIDAGGENKPDWRLVLNQNTGQPRSDPERWRPPVDIGPTPDPDPKPDPTLPDLRPVLAKLTEMQSELQSEIAGLSLSVQMLLDRHTETIRWPVFEGTATIPYLGKAPITMSPKP